MRVWRKRNPSSCWWDCRLVQPLWKAVWRCLIKLNRELPFDPAIPLLGIYPEKTTTRKDTCTPMFIAALFTIAKTWKQPKCPSTEAWIKKMWYIYTMENHSAIKKNEMPAFFATWMDLETIMLSEVSRTMRHQYPMLSLTLESEKRTDWTSLQNRCWLTDIEKLMVSRGDILGGGGDVLGLWDRNPVQLDCYDHYTTTHMIS